MANAQVVNFGERLTIRDKRFFAKCEFNMRHTAARFMRSPEYEALKDRGDREQRTAFHEWLVANDYVTTRGE